MYFRPSDYVTESTDEPLEMVIQGQLAYRNRSQDPWVKYGPRALTARVLAKRMECDALTLRVADLEAQVERLSKPAYHVEKGQAKAWGSVYDCCRELGMSSGGPHTGLETVINFITGLCEKLDNKDNDIHSLQVHADAWNQVCAAFCMSGRLLDEGETICGAVVRLIHSGAILSEPVGWIARTKFEPEDDEVAAWTPWAHVLKGDIALWRRRCTEQPDKYQMAQCFMYSQPI